MRRLGVFLLAALAAIATTSLHADDSLVKRETYTGLGKSIGILKFTLRCPWVNFELHPPAVAETRLYSFHISDIGALRSAIADYEVANPEFGIRIPADVYGWYSHIPNSGWDPLVTETSTHYFLDTDVEIDNDGCVTGDRLLSKTTLEMKWAFTYHPGGYCRRSMQPRDVTLQCELVEYVEPKQTIGF